MSSDQAPAEHRARQKRPRAAERRPGAQMREVCHAGLFKYSQGASEGPGARPVLIVLVQKLVQKAFVLV